MSDSFRFLINVDQCLNMSRYGMFFYKLESQHRFHASQVQLFGEDFGSSLHHAALDIRSYLNKYSYYVDDFQIVVAMRSEYREKSKSWRETMLYRLLQLHYELLDAKIFVISHERTARAVNLIMLHEVDFNGEHQSVDNYLSGSRLMEDCRLLFQEVGLSWEEDRPLEECRQKLDAYELRPGHDSAVLKLLSEYFRRARGSVKDGGDPILNEEQEANGSRSQTDHQQLFVSYVKGKLDNYHVFEDLINRNDERAKTLTMLKLVEYVNCSTAPQSTATGDSDPRSLADRCADNWSRIEDDPTLEQRYANMLFDYRETLQAAQLDLERGGYDHASSAKLPAKHIPADDEIRPEGSNFGENDRKSTELALKEKMEAFEKRGLRGGLVAWDATYTQLKESLESMEKDLKEYARGLSSRYAAAIEQRKAETLPWERENYDPGPDLEAERLETVSDREQRLKELKKSHIRSSLSFQDQLNMENALDKCNADIRFKMHCAKAVSASNFFVLALMILLMFLGHYAVLQPYVFQDEELLFYALLYILAAAVLLFSAWKLPGLYFRHQIKNDINELKQSMDTYVRGYFEKADFFLRYINLLNQLDYISRYSAMLLRVRDRTEYMDKGVKWHLVQVRQHLDLVNTFRDLIEKRESRNAKESYPKIEPTDQSGKIRNVIKCQVYWPQG